MSLNFLVRGKVDNLPQSQKDGETRALPAISPPKPQRERLSGVPSSAEPKMTDDLHAIATLIGQLSDEPPGRGVPRPKFEEAADRDDNEEEEDGVLELSADNSAHEDPLFDECQATLARLDAAKNSGESLLSQIEAFSGTLERQAAELSMARASMAKLASDNSRLVNENDRLRVMLRSLLDAIDADARRNNESIAAAERRLRDLHRPAGDRQGSERSKQPPARGLVAEG
ncbi:hypothetical protein JL100_019675 [Skermanella mucosa]|uniref:hypothetical protein n=1 Tax=Skermanella mucosa TaxID=1789672 RepID=UPI00192CC32C|nr:hypothetical protein [Skermanella mucosa]UEM19301.1 hypothetical protein JL100_019675 [Skermanella mucosa]